MTLCGRYFLREFAGSGGTADVYLAWDRIRSAKLAVKVLRPDVKGKALLLFENEARLLRQLEHPFIVRRYELERHGELVFLVMDWVEGNNLRQRIGELRRPFSLEETERILSPVCSALNFTHQNGVYHCDIKPANILLHQDGHVLLTDFGVARLASEQRSGGTPAYMAPEQIWEGLVDARTDVYALGVTLYEMLSGGVLPFRGEGRGSQGSTQRERIEWEHCNLPAPPLSQFNPSLPADVVQVVHRALSKDPEERYSSVLKLLETFGQARNTPAQPWSGPTGPETSLHRLDQPGPAAPPAINPPNEPRPRPERGPVGPASPIIRQDAPAPPAGSGAGWSLLPVSGPHLFCKAGQYAGQSISIRMKRMTIGRLRGSHIALGDPSVSRTHASLVRTRRGVYIEDEGSTLGTYVNNKRIVGPQELRSGDVISIGSGQVFEYRKR
jgi:serine/threonine protein kinase